MKRQPRRGERKTRSGLRPGRFTEALNRRAGFRMLAALDVTDYVVLAVLLLCVLGAAASTRPSDQARLRRVERKLDHLLKHLGVDVPDATTAAGLSDAVRRLADEGRKIAAVKLHREEGGLGLAEAKVAVESYLAGLGQRGAGESP